MTKAEYMKKWKYACENWEALDENAYQVSVSGILRVYNSLQLQPNPYFGAELNYYKSFRSGYDRAYEKGDYSVEEEKIGHAFNVNEALKEAIEFEMKNSSRATFPTRSKSFRFPVAFLKSEAYNTKRQGELAKSRLRVDCIVLTHNLIWIMPT